jgi:hypothetical protein
MRMDQKDSETNTGDTTDSRDQYVSEIMEIDAQAAEVPDLPKKKRSWVPVLVVLLPVFVALTVWNVVRLSREPAAFPPALEEASARFTIYLIAQAVEDYRDSTAALPPDLATIDMDEEEIDYAVLDSTYTLTTTVGRTVIVYEQGEDLTSYGDAFQELAEAAER